MRAAGALFEERSCKELRRAGLQLIERNYTTRFGEIDLVMRDDESIVFVEVRHRLRATQGGAAASVTASKQRKLIAAAQLWLAAHSRYVHAPCRFDVVAYDGPFESAQMTWYRSAFEQA